MASQTKEAEKHRQRQALRAFDVPICPDFARKGHVHTPGCPNHIPPEKP